MDIESYFDAVEAYVQGRLSAEESQAFDARLASDPELGRALNLYRLSLAALDLQGEEELRRLLAAGRPSGLPAPRRLAPWYAAAAAVLLLALAGAVSYARSAYSDEALLARHAGLPAVLATQRMGASEAEPGSGSDALLRGQWQEAIAALRAESEGPDSLRARLGLAYAQAQAGDSEAAERLYQRLAASEDPAIAESAQWQAALLALRQGDEARARQALEAIAAQPEHLYAPQAQALLAQLGSFWRKIRLF
jgi:hypothetical protein